MVVSAFQTAGMREGTTSVGLMLAEQGVAADPVAEVRATSLNGWASDGRSMEGLVGQVATSTALARDRMVITQVADAARLGSVLGMSTRPGVDGYIRMVQPGACSRCVVLAGRRYRSRDAFDRHPGCNCVHIPESEDSADDFRTHPDLYFESLSASEQDRIFTKAGAQAIRDGADIGQVVNARAGMSTSQPILRGKGDRFTARGRLARVRVFGQDVYTTTEGMTKRGVAYKARAGKQIRLMPESIVELADTTEERIRLLKAHGYII